MIEISSEKENLDKTLVGKDNGGGGGFIPRFGVVAMLGVVGVTVILIHNRKDQR